LLDNFTQLSQGLCSVFTYNVARRRSIWFKEPEGSRISRQRCKTCKTEDAVGRLTNRQLMASWWC